MWEALWPPSSSFTGSVLGGHTGSSAWGSPRSTWIPESVSPAPHPEAAPAPPSPWDSGQGRVAGHTGRAASAASELPGKTSNNSEVQLTLR